MVKKGESKVTKERQKVFIVDDDKSICRALKFLLITFGYEVRTFSSGTEFFDSVEDAESGCLVLDIHMPELNGWEIQRKLASVGSQRQIIVITADKDDGLREKALKVGALGFLQKPFNDMELVDLINQSFRTPQENSMKNNILMIMTALVFTTTILGCNMFKGAGKDMENAGESIQKTADRN
jgi:two-component system response regulator FixJ